MTIRNNIARWLLREETQKLDRASSAFKDLYARWPAIFAQMATQGEQAAFRELDSRYIDLLSRQIAYNSSTVNYEATEADRRLAVDTSRRQYDVDPVVEAMINTGTNFGFGVNVEVVPADPRAKKIWNAFLKDPQNAYILGQRKLQENSTLVLRDGDFLFTFFANKMHDSSKHSGSQVKIRRVDTFEIQGGLQGNGIITKPDDKNIPLMYRQQVFQTKGNRVQYYRDWAATDEDLNELLGRVTIRDDNTDYLNTDDGVIMHEYKKEVTDVVGLFVAYHTRGLRGWPLATTGLPWSAAYKNFMQDRAAIQAANAAHFEKVKMKNAGQRLIDQFVTSNQSSLVTNANAYETNPVRAAGGQWVENDQLEMTKLPMSTGSGDAATDGRALLGMAGLAARIAPHWLNNGEGLQWAVAQEMRLPMIREWNLYQLFWSSIFRDMLTIVIKMATLYDPAYKGQDISNECNVSTDALLGADVAELVSIMASVNESVTAQTLSIPDAMAIQKAALQAALQSVGVRDVDKIMLPKAAPELAPVPQLAQLTPPATVAPVESVGEYTSAQQAAMNEIKRFNDIVEKMYHAQVE